MTLVIHFKTGRKSLATWFHSNLTAHAEETVLNHLLKYEAFGENLCAADEKAEMENSSWLESVLN